MACFPESLPGATVQGMPLVGIAVSSALACAVLLLKFSDSLVETFTFMMTLSTLSLWCPTCFRRWLCGVSARDAIKRGGRCWGGDCGLLWLGYFRVWR